MKPIPFSMEDKIEICNRFYYKTGSIFNKSNGSNRIKDKEAGVFDKRGYGRVHINGRKILVHRVIFFLCYGWCPDYIDHIDGNKRNNSADNLRECTSSQNMYNKPSKGYSYRGRVGKYESYMTVEGKFKSLGYFTKESDARKAYEVYAKEFLGEYYCSTKTVTT